MEWGINLTLEPRSHKALRILTFPIMHGVEKLSGSLSLEGNYS